MEAFWWEMAHSYKSDPSQATDHHSITMSPSLHILLFALLSCLSCLSHLCHARSASPTSLLDKGHPLAKDPKVLSRRRRFLNPATSGYSIAMTFSTAVPFPDLRTALSIAMPFRYFFDSGT